MFKTLKLCFSAVLVTTLMLLGGGAYAQNISLRVNDVSVQNALEALQKAWGYSIAVDPQGIDLSRIVSVDAEGKDAASIVRMIFAGQDVNVEVNGKKITVTGARRPAAGPSDGRVYVKGRVTDQDGEPLIGVGVIIKGSSTGVITDVDGNYSIMAQSDAILVFSYIGYKDAEENIGGRGIIDVVLSPDVNQLDEIVVIGYDTQKKINLTGAVAVQEMKNLENRPMTHASEALYGIPGLYVNQSSAKPGSDGATIRVRGTGTITSGASDPLVLVDGVEYPLSEVNPDNIESISVLKDASASIYGSKSANGVILVTTKKASKGYSSIRFKLNTGIQQAISLPDMVTDPIQFMEMYNQAERNVGRKVVTYSDAEIKEYRDNMGNPDSKYPYAYPSTDWKKEVFSPGVFQEYNLSFSGNGSNISYSISGGYMNQKGVLVTSDDAQRYSVDFKVDANVTRNLKVAASLNGNIRTNTDPVYGVTDIMNGYNRTVPLVGTVDNEGRYLNTWLNVPGQNVFYNPLLILNSGSIKRKYQRLLLRLNAEYTLPFGIVWKNTFGYDKFDGFIKTHKLAMNTYNPKTFARQAYSDYYYVSNYDYNSLNYTFFSTFNWSRRLNNVHDLSAMLGFEWKSYDSANFSARMNNYFNELLSELKAGSDMNMIDGNSEQSRLASVFARVNYNYKGKYLVEVISRYDGSSKFSKQNRWSFFPSISFGWRMDKEDFLTSANVDLLKIRASIGQMGNQAIGNYKYLMLVNPSNSYNYSFGGETNPGAAIDAFVDNTISWETTTSIDVGFDLAMFDNRLSAGLDIYGKYSDGVLRTVNIPSQVGGLTGPVRNIGKVGNYGAELSAGYRNHIGNFSYGINANVSYNINRVLKLGEELKGEFRVTKEGLPIDSWYLYQADGFFKDKNDIMNSPVIAGADIRPGYIKYKDMDGDRKITDNDRVYSGNTEPSTVYGFNISFGWKGLELTANFQGVADVAIYLDGNAAAPFYNGAGVAKEWAADSWTPENTDSRLPILHTSAGAPYMHDYKNTQWLYDASYLRCKQLQLAYTLPAAFIAKAKMSRLQIFLNANNLFTITENRLFDPEIATTQANIAQYPSLRTFNGGVNITF